MKINSIQIIVNPVSGEPKPVLRTFNRYLLQSHIKWDISIIRHPDDVKEAVSNAYHSQADVIAVYGGDGTIGAVAQNVYKKDKPLLVLPGGTANVFAASLEIPPTIEETMRLLTKGIWKKKKIDVALINGKPFLLALSTGVIAQTTMTTPRKFKNQFGELAYVVNSLRLLPKTKPVVYNLEIDGNAVETEAYALIVANSGEYSLAGLPLLEGLDNTDGLIDILVVRTINPVTLFRILALQKEKRTKYISQWKAKCLKITIPDNEPVLVDDAIVKTPFTANIMVDPLAMVFLVPVSE